MLPLGLDTFAVSVALAVRGLAPRERMRAALVLSSFEMAMPIVGLLLGTGLGAAVGRVGDYAAAAALLALGTWMAFFEDDEGDEVDGLSSREGLALLALGLSISLDELAIGFTIGLLELSIVLAVVLIGAQAFVLAQLGLRLGSWIGERAREWAERAAGVALIGLGALVLAETLVHS